MRGDFRDRRYSDEELRRIIEDAARAEFDRGVEPGTQGHTLDEIREIAAEVGIASADVDRAAANLLASGTGAQHPTHPLPRVLHAERVIERGLSDTEMRKIVERAEAVVGRPGLLRNWGSLVEWRDRDDRVYVGIARGEAQTRVRVIADQSQEISEGLGIVGVMGFLGLVAASGGAGVEILLGAGLVLAAACGSGGGYWRWRTGRTRGHLEELLDLLEDAVRPS